MSAKEEVKKILNKLVMDWTHRSNEAGQGVRHIDHAHDQIIELFRECLKKIGKETVNVIIDIQKEIEANPRYANIGKKGCLKRVQKLYEYITEAEKKIDIK